MSVVADWRRRASSGLHFDLVRGSARSPLQKGKRQFNLIGMLNRGFFRTDKQGHRVYMTISVLEKTASGRQKYESTVQEGRGDFLKVLVVLDLRMHPGFKLRSEPVRRAQTHQK